MPRAMSPALLAASQAKNVKPAVFVSIQFASSTEYMWSGVGPITWNGQTWKGLGRLLGVSVMADGLTVEARGITITLSGLDATLLADCMTDFKLGLPVSVSFGIFSGSILIPDPITSWSGRTDEPTIDMGADTATIAINCENRLFDMNIAVDRRLTNQDQQMTWPGDLGLQFVDAIQEMTLFLAGFPNNTNNI